MSTTDNKKSSGSHLFHSHWGWGIGIGVILGMIVFLVVAFLHHKKIVRNCAREREARHQQQEIILRDAIKQELTDLEKKHADTLRAFAVLAQEARLQSQRLRELRTLTRPKGTDTSGDSY